MRELILVLIENSPVRVSEGKLLSIRAKWSELCPGWNVKQV